MHFYAGWWSLRRIETCSLNDTSNSVMLNGMTFIIIEARHNGMNCNKNLWFVLINMLLVWTLFYYQLMHTTLKNAQLLKHSKLDKNAPTCFGLHRNHLQGAKFFVKFFLFRNFTKIYQHYQLWLKWNNNNRHFTWRLMNIDLIGIYNTERLFFWRVWTEA